MFGLELGMLRSDEEVLYNGCRRVSFASGLLYKYRITDCFPHVTHILSLDRTKVSGTGTAGILRF